LRCFHTRQPIGQLVDRRGRQIHEQLRQVSLRINRVALAGAAPARQERNGLAANFNKGDSGADLGPGPLSDPALVAFAEANGLMADVPEPASFATGIGLLFGLIAHRKRRTSCSCS
jgi:hypothetical protein